MKIKSIVIVFIAMLSIAVSAVFAQNYQIRTGAKVNLRATHSTRGAVVETVPAGTVLQVVGKFNRWLKINRNGNNVWMADWVRHSRVTGAAPPPPSSQQPAPQPAPSQQQSQVDNYCYTTWTCTSAEDWTRGYHAYQRDAAQGNLQSGSSAPHSADHAGGSPLAGRTYYELLGEQEMVTRIVQLTQGTWNVQLFTAAIAIVNVNTVDVPGCLDHTTSWVSGWATRFRSVRALAWKSHNRAGDDNQANGTITVHRDCNVSFHVWAPGHTWSLKLIKS